MNQEKMPQFWLEKAVQEIIDARPEGEIIVSSGASPSGMYHIGHLREFLTADAIAWGLRQKNRQAKHIHFVDDVDRFRKVPSNVDPSFEQYLGRPLYLVPAPDGSDQSYAAYWFGQINQAMQAMGAEMEVVFSHERYNEGYFAEAITTTLNKLPEAKLIIETVSGRQLSSRWAPVQILDDNDSFDTRWFTGFNSDTKTISYDSKDGQSGEIAYDTGRVKLDWRLDWPARWSLIPVAVEPFGRDHATKGGSYDTGKELVEKIFDSPAPIAYPYEFINLKGETKKMSASDGTGILPLDALQIMPAPMLKNFVLGVRPSLQLFLDIGPGFGRMFDEFSTGERADQTSDISAIKLAKTNDEGLVLPTVPFNHMVVAWQSAQKDADQAIEILKRSEHAETVETQRELIVSVFPYIETWLDKWAPNTLKFIIQQELPEVELSENQKQLLSDLSARISEAPHDADGEWYHLQIHEVREVVELSPKEAFQAIYRVILNKESGPKAGWFLSTFDAQWLAERFKAASR